MSTGPNPLVVRGSKRYSCDVPAQASIATEQHAAIKLSRTVAGGGGILEVRLADFSQGGLGLHSMVYFAPGTRLLIQIEGEPLPVSVRVQRSSMADRSPRYYLGTSFMEAGGTGVFERLKSRTAAA